MATQSDLNIIRDIILKGLQDYPVQVYLFGSQATGRASKMSDIDVAVLPQGDLPVGLLSQIREALENSPVPYRVDLIDLSQTDKTFRQRVLKEGVSWTA
ncbi:MAG: nucleotidyltransferase family protein [Desulfuromonadales bacterium]